MDNQDNIKDMNMIDENEDNIIELIDEETGKSTRFEHIATVEHEGEMYIMVAEEETLLAEDENEQMEFEALVLKISTDENGEDFYETIEDEETANTVFQKCLKVIDEEFEQE